MEKANLQKLRIYELAELLAGHVWGIVVGWGRFPRKTVGATCRGGRQCGSEYC